MLVVYPRAEVKEAVGLYGPGVQGWRCVWAGDLNLGVIGLEMGPKFRRQENTEE